MHYPEMGSTESSSPVISPCSPRPGCKSPPQYSWILIWKGATPLFALVLQTGGRDNSLALYLLKDDRGERIFFLQNWALDLLFNLEFPLRLKSSNAYKLNICIAYENDVCYKKKENIPEISQGPGQPAMNSQVLFQGKPVGGFWQHTQIFRNAEK